MMDGWKNNTESPSQMQTDTYSNVPAYQISIFNSNIAGLYRPVLRPFISETLKYSTERHSYVTWPAVKTEI